MILISEELHNLWNQVRHHVRSLEHAAIKDVAVHGDTAAVEWLFSKLAKKAATYL